MWVRHHADFPRGWWRCVRGAVSVVGLLLALTACGASTTATRATHDGQRETSINILDPNSVDDLLSSIARVGLPVPNPRHVTERDCPGIGCTDKVDTDTVSIMKFPNSGRAELYAGSTHHRFQVADVVMTFSPTVPPSQQLEYERAVERAVE